MPPSDVVTAGGEGGGLVPYSTSVQGTPWEGILPPAGFFIDTAAARLARLKSAVLTTARLIGEELRSNPLRHRAWMTTLTYRPGEQWKPYHITRCLKHIRRWADRRGVRFRYVWVSEIQEKRHRNGGPLGECVHYHLVMWLPVFISMPMADKQGWWPHGMTQRVQVKAPISYLTKYVSKGGGVEFPKGLRLHGSGGISSEGRNERAWWALPRWVRVIWQPSDLPRRCKGGGFVSRVSSLWFPSIFRVSLRFGSVYCCLRDDLFSFFPIALLSRILEVL